MSKETEKNEKNDIEISSNILYNFEYLFGVHEKNTLFIVARF
jgi:hypothetical protein